MSKTQHPFPTLVRDGWINLNGEWDFEYIPADTDISELTPSKKINVPFLPGHPCSGVTEKCTNAVYYMRKFKLQRCPSVGRTFLKFGGIKGIAEIFINGKPVQKHSGIGMFSFDASKALKCGENRIEVIVHGDDAGIYQSVIVESVPSDFISDLKFTRTDNGVQISGHASCSDTLHITTLSNGIAVTTTNSNSDGSFCCELNLPCEKKWSIGHGGLYDVIIHFKDDTVITYFGIAESIQNEKTTLLPEYNCGGFTAPSDSEQENLIKKLIANGFTTAEVNTDETEARLIYCADKLGLKILPDTGFSNVV